MSYRSGGKWYHTPPSTASWKADTKVLGFGVYGLALYIMSKQSGSRRCNTQTPAFGLAVEGGHRRVVRHLFEDLPHAAPAREHHVGARRLTQHQGLTLPHSSAQPKSFWSVSRFVFSF
jgi:hypothetical protein